MAASAGESFGDVRIEVDVRFEAGPEAGAYLQCRGSQDSGDFYFFRLGADGFVEITDVAGGEEQVTRGRFLDAGVLQPGWNRLRADCLGDNLSLFVNGTLVVERSLEGGHAAGDIGLGAGGGAAGLSNVRFDNLSVSRP